MFSVNHIISHKMSIINLPTELQRNIRQYGYNPIVNDEELYVMIRQLKPTYSLMSLYDRLVAWKSQFNKYNIDNEHELYNTYIKDKDKDVYWVTRTNITYKNDIDAVDRNMPTINVVNNNVMTQSHSAILAEYLLNIQSDPINPVDVINCEGLLQYNHVPVKPRPSFYDYDPKIVSMITDLYPSFSLQKEYQKLSIRKRYSDMLDPTLASFLIDIDEILSNIFYNPKSRQLTLYLDGILENYNSKLRKLEYNE